MHTFRFLIDPVWFGRYTVVLVAESRKASAILLHLLKKSKKNLICNIQIFSFTQLIKQ